MPTALEIDSPEAGIVLLRLNRPERLNALNEVLVRELRKACGALATDTETRVVVLTGAGRGFCSGLDLRGFGESAPGPSTATVDLLHFQEMMAGLPAGLRALPQPVIAAINGPAFGGGLALCLGADIRVCAASATFANAAIKLGLSGAEMGMSYHLPRIVGTSVASDWMLTGRTVDADEALRTGLVSAVVDDDGLLDHAMDLARQAASFSLLALEMTKRAIQVNVDAPDLASALELENRNQIITSSTPESREATAKWSNRS